MKKARYLLLSIACAFLFTGCETPDYPGNNEVAPGTVGGVFAGTSVSATVDGTTVTVAPVNVALSKDFCRGFDASAVNDPGNTDFYDPSGVKKDIFVLLKQYGVNYVRLRVWNNPDSTKNPDKPGYSNKAVVVDQAVRAKNAGLKVLLDFHYSDYWADPGKQLIPEDWLDASDSDDMAARVAAWTKEVIAAMAANNAAPDMIQIGNEINSGILYHSAISDTDKTEASSSISGKAGTANNIKYLTAGINAAREAAPKAKIMLHFASSSFSPLTVKPYVDANLDFDVVGISWYPEYDGHGTIETLGSRINTIKQTYGKEVMVAETSFNHTYDKDLSVMTKNLKTGGKMYDDVNVDKSGNVIMSVQNQASVIRAVIETTAKNGGSGVFTWGCEYKGGWKAMFAGNGKPLASMIVYSVEGN